MKELSEGKLKGLLGVMFVHSMAYIRTMGISEEKREEIKKAHRQIRKLIEGKPKVTMSLIDKWTYEINDVWAGRIKEKDFIISLFTEIDIEIEK